MNLSLWFLLMAFLAAAGWLVAIAFYLMFRDAARHWDICLDLAAEINDDWGKTLDQWGETKKALEHAVADHLDTIGICKRLLKMLKGYSERNDELAEKVKTLEAALRVYQLQDPDYREIEA